MMAKTATVLVVLALLGCRRAPPGPAALAEPSPSPPAAEKKVVKMKTSRGEPRLDYTGTARDAKGGAVLVMKHGAVAYVEGRERWEDSALGKTVTVRGRLVEKAHLPVARRSPGGAISQGVDPAAPLQWVLVEAEVVPRAESPSVLPLALMRAVAPDWRACLDSVARALREAGEDPAGFFVGHEAQAGPRLHLWHRSAFTPENRRMLGNPGGKCRDALCDESGKLQRFLFWQ